jgi:hypothetical protein
MPDAPPVMTATPPLRDSRELAFGDAAAIAGGT